MAITIIKNARIVNEGKIVEGDVLIRNQRIERIDGEIGYEGAAHELDAHGKYLLPGLIDDQVHFREPGLTHKGDLYTESRAAVAGGITSFMEMPNTVPQATTQALLAEKYARAAQVSVANYSFFMGTTNHNLEEVLATDPKNVCGIKIFMGSSTGDMLVDNPSILESVFSRSPVLIATHCEDEATIRRNSALAREQFGEDVPMHQHPVIRNTEACWLSSSFAAQLARKHGTRLHILHISTARELELFDNSIPLEKKRITAEACIHHLWFTEEDYAEKGSLIKWNPAVKAKSDRDAIRQAVLDNRIDVIATDHAPHTIEEKQRSYFNAPSGGPLVQHALPALLHLVADGWCDITQIAEKTAHAPATLFRIPERGYIREGYFADLVLVDLSNPYTVNKNNLLYKCQWSPFEGHTFSSSVLNTWVNGHLAYSKGQINDSLLGMRLAFNPE